MLLYFISIIIFFNVIKGIYLNMAFTFTLRIYKHRTQVAPKSWNHQRIYSDLQISGKVLSN